MAHMGRDGHGQGCKMRGSLRELMWNSNCHHDSATVVAMESDTRFESLVITNFCELLIGKAQVPSGIDTHSVFRYCI